MQITPEYLAMMALLGGGIGFLWNKLDQIRKELSDISNHAVTHTVCESRREKCPCVKDVAELKATLRK
ncbi:MAG: hypothetical protein L3J71_02470 [Victivallaceae bacterium]|nr:hypothetical protein [Victivallaceae bacterium]